MANVRDSDTSLWLHNKLGTSNDSWTGGSICSQLNAEVLKNIKDCFPELQTQVKLKLLLSFFHIPRRNVEEWRLELEEIIEVAGLDSELWVSMLAEAMKTFPSTGSLNTEITDLDDVRPIFTDLVNDLRKLVKKQAEVGMLPLECHYLNKAALISVVGQQSPPSKHFNIKKKPKSAYLRAELLQKSSDAASNLKKASAPVIPVRSRGMPRKMTDTTPLKGIPSRVPTSGFRSGSLTNNAGVGRPLPRPPAGRKDGGVKFLEIADQPIGSIARKRKRMQELEEAKKAAEQTALQSPPVNGTTPDYAAGLSATPSYAPATPQPSKENLNTSSVTTAAPSVPTVTTPATVTSAGPDARPKVTVTSVIIKQPTGDSTVSSTTPATVPTQTTLIPIDANIPTAIMNSRPVVTQIRLQPSVNTSQRKGLALTREQMLEAQDMFRTANKVTRPEKALILGFMAGSRENPCPHLGNIVTIKLSEEQEIQEDMGQYHTMLIETHFQMNYNNGEWKRIKKIKHIETVQSLEASNASNAATAAAIM